MLADSCSRGGGEESVGCKPGAQGRCRAGTMWGNGRKPAGRCPAGLESSGQQGEEAAEKTRKSLLHPHAWADSDMLAEINSLSDACRHRVARNMLIPL